MTPQAAAVVAGVVFVILILGGVAIGLLFAFLWSSERVSYGEGGGKTAPGPPARGTLVDRYGTRADDVAPPPADSTVEAEASSILSVVRWASLALFVVAVLLIIYVVSWFLQVFQGPFREL